jgi:hypothetical protein
MDPKNSRRKRKLLHDVDVTHVSLVDRPANRTPFKFVKREDGADTKGEFPMHIQLKNLFGSRSPQVTSVIAKSEATAKAAAALLMEGGEGVLTETDGVFVVRKSGTEPTETEQLVHAGTATGVAYTVDNLRKSLALYDMDTQSFDEAVKAEGFVPSLMIGMDALHTTIRNIAMDEDTKSPDDMRGKVAKALSDFSTYIEAMIGELPETAFKFEKALVAVAPTEIGGAGAAPGEGFNSEVYDAVFGGAQEAGEAGSEAGSTEGTAAGATETPAEAAENVVTTDTTDDVKADEAGAEAAEAASEAEPAPANLEELPAGTAETPRADFEAALAAAMADLTKSIGGEIAKVAKSVEGLSQRVDAQEQASTKLAKAVGGTVASEAEADPDPNVVQLRNSAGSGDDIPLMDTAYGGARK